MASAIRRSLFILSLFSLATLAADLDEDLFEAVQKSQVETVKALLAKGANVNARNRYGATPLFFAANRGNLEIIHMLLDRGADVNLKDNFYSATPLSWAVMKGHIAVVRLLFEKGASGVDEVLMSGVSNGNIELVKLALAKGGLKPETLTSALVNAERNNRAELSELLKKAGATPPKPGIEVDPETLQSYEGAYSAEGFDVKFQVIDGKLMASTGGQKPLALEAVDKTTFRPGEIPGMSITFNIENGKVVGATMKQGSQTTVLKKAGAE